MDLKKNVKALEFIFYTSLQIYSCVLFIFENLFSQALSLLMFFLFNLFGMANLV